MGTCAPRIYVRDNIVYRRKNFDNKLAMGKFTRHRIVVDESRVIYTNNQVVNVSSEYTSVIASYFNIKNQDK